jgi:hypothetical protein
MRGEETLYSEANQPSYLLINGFQPRQLERIRKLYSTCNSDILRVLQVPDRERVHALLQRYTAKVNAMLSRFTVLDRLSEYPEPLKMPPLLATTPKMP